MRKLKLTLPRSKRVRLGVLLAALCLFGGGVLFFGRQIVTRQAEYRAAREEYADLRDYFDTDSASAHPQIDFAALWAVNPDVVGWISIPETAVDYPIVQGADNERYLNHTLSGQRNASGAIFMDYRDDSDFGGHVRIYGHNMRDGSMLASLHGFTGDTIFIYTPDGRVLEYEVFFRGNLAADDERLVTDIEEEALTLVTCINNRPDIRFVIRARPV